MNELVRKNKSTTSSYLQGKNHTYKKLYCKLNNIDTIIIDNVTFFDYNNIYNGNKYLKNIIIDLNNPRNLVDINLNGKTTIENISYLNYPMLEGITIPLDVVNERLGISIFVDLESTFIKKINILNGENIEEINIDDTVSWYRINKIKLDDANKLNINIGYKNNDNKTIIYDISGNKSISYENQTIVNSDEIDLREYKNTNNITYNKKEYHKIIGTFILTPELLKNKDFKNFKYIFVDKLIIIDDSEMILNPFKLELNKVVFDIISKRSTFGNKLSNVIYIEKMNDEKAYVYINEDNELKIIDSEKLKNNNLIDKYKFIKKEGNVGVIIKYKKDLKFDLIINNKLFHINKMFINWYLNNTTLYDEKIIPRECKLFSNGLENIYDYSKDNYKIINEYIFDSLLEQITEVRSLDDFNKMYKDYQYYIKHIKDLINKGYSYKSLVYLHKNCFDNITGIKGRYRNIEDKELIDSFNNISKKLIRRK